MRYLFLLLSISASAAAPGQIIPNPLPPPLKSNRLYCRTGAELRPPGQPLELFLQYFLPVVFEPEDPTVPYSRQAMSLSGRPVVQLHFKKSAEPAGENGEKLEPMTCAFAKRIVSSSEPRMVQIYMPAGQIQWLSQGIGQRPEPKTTSQQERLRLAPAGDWAFASQFDKVFYVDLDDAKRFITTQLPRAQ